LKHILWLVNDYKRTNVFTLTFWSLSVVGTSQDTVSRNRFNYNKADIPALKTELGKVNWRELMNNLSTEDSWNVFRENLEDLEYRYIPVKMLSSKK